MASNRDVPPPLLADRGTANSPPANDPAGVDPTDLLAALAVGPASEAEARRDFRTAYTTQLAACRGLTGLLSARVRLLPHQVEVVRRVCQAPHIRHLLADEVGLGKTVEAGAIIRQLRLGSASNIVVFAPAPLVPQWHGELRRLFTMTREDSSTESCVAVWPHERLLRPFLRDDFPLHLVVIDEAHQVVAPAGATADQQRLAEAARAMARRSRHLLLLSATPVRKKEEELLQLLHLLDPRRFPLGALEPFRVRLALRDALGRQVLALASARNPRNVVARAEAVAALLPDDPAVATLTAQVHRTDGRDLTAAAELGAHLAEEYRVHRRMLRTRRRFLREFAEANGWHLPRRRCQQPECETDPRLPALWDALEEWRIPVAAAVGRASASRRTEAAKNYFRLARQIVSFRAELPDLVRRYLADGRVPGYERRPLERLADFATRQGGSRADALSGLLARLRDQGGRQVVFCVESAVCVRLAAELNARRVNGVAVAHRRLPPAAVEAALHAFQHDPACHFLLADDVLDEGHNLQHAGGLVSADLPYRPMRVEQQIGRIDRLGRDNDVPCHTLLTLADPAVAVDAGWFRVLRDGFGLFDESASDVQLLMQREVERLREVALFHGPAALAAEAANVRACVERERTAAGEQDVIDGLDLTDPDVSAVWRELTAAEQPAWTTRLWSGFAGVSAAVGLRPDEAVTADRAEATLSPHRRLLRPGYEPADGLADQLGTSRTGRGFAVWRREAGRTEPRVVFRAVVICRADDSRFTASAGWQTLDEVGRAAVRLSVADWFPPAAYELFVEDDAATSDEVAAACRPPFDPHADRDLAANAHLVAEVFPRGAWEPLVRRTVAAVVEQVRRSFVAARVSAATVAADEFARLRRTRDGVSPAEEEFLRCVRSAVEEPRVELDSLGVYLLSDVPPTRRGRK